MVSSAALAARNSCLWCTAQRQPVLPLSHISGPIPSSCVHQAILRFNFTSFDSRPVRCQPADFKPSTLSYFPQTLTMSEKEATAPTTQEVENAEPKENVAAPKVADASNKETEENKDPKEPEVSKESDAGEPNGEDAKSLYEFTVKDIDGNEVSLSKYKGHPTLIVNVASSCGFTKTNYNQLNELYTKYESQGLRIAAFPSNQFMNQESACDVDIKEFAKKNNVHFDMYAKIAVNGNDTIPLYRWLKNKQRGILGTTAIKWNFTKFLVNKEGVPIKRYSPTTSPNSIEPDIKALLA